MDFSLCGKKLVVNNKAERGTNLRLDARSGVVGFAFELVTHVLGSTLLRVGLHGSLDLILYRTRVRNSVSRVGDEYER